MLRVVKLNSFYAIFLIDYYIFIVFQIKFEALIHLFYIDFELNFQTHIKTHIKFTYKDKKKIKSPFLYISINFNRFRPKIEI